LEVGQETGEFGSAEAQTLTDAGMAQIPSDQLDSFEHVESKIEEALLQSPYTASAKMVILALDRRDRAPDFVKRVELDRIDQYLSIGLGGSREQ
jgi:hypothetical protein